MLRTHVAGPIARACSAHTPRTCLPSCGADRALSDISELEKMEIARSRLTDCSCCLPSNGEHLDPVLNSASQSRDAHVPRTAAGDVYVAIGMYMQAARERATGRHCDTRTLYRANAAGKKATRKRTVLTTAVPTFARPAMPR